MERVPFAITAGHRATLQNALAATHEYELAARDLELGLEQSDSTAVLSALGSIESSSTAVSNGLLLASSPMMATAQSARLTVADFTADTDSLTNDGKEADVQRLLAFSAATDWLEEPLDETLRQAAIATLRAAIEGSRSSTPNSSTMRQYFSVRMRSYLAIEIRLVRTSFSETREYSWKRGSRISAWHSVNSVIQLHESPDVVDVEGGYDRKPRQSGARCLSDHWLGVRGLPSDGRQ